MTRNDDEDDDTVCMMAWHAERVGLTTHEYDSTAHEGVVSRVVTTRSAPPREARSRCRGVAREECEARRARVTDLGLEPRSLGRVAALGRLCELLLEPAEDENENETHPTDRVSVWSSGWEARGGGSVFSSSQHRANRLSSTSADMIL